MPRGSAYVAHGMYSSRADGPVITWLPERNAELPPGVAVPTEDELLDENIDQECLQASPNVDAGR
eukprot:1127203-Karenia_brevis.AAC.1